MAQEHHFFSVMVIDDNDIDNLINQKLIENSKLGKHVLVHTGAKSALEFLANIEKVAEGNAQLVPGIIFLDIDMPIMDGFQFLEEFEKLGDFVKNSTRVVMLTSSLSPYDLSKAKKNPRVTDFINKPLTVDNLVKLKTA